MNHKIENRAEHEIAHGQFLAEGDPESIWGWGTPAGKLRARRRGQLVAQAAQLQTQRTAMEIGCGTGMFSAIFAETGARIVAVDISPELIDQANQRGLPDDQVEFHCARFEDFSTESSFDAVIGSSVLHHLELDEALQQIMRLLKPGGFMAFAEPNMLNPQVFAERTFMRDRLDYVSPDETAFVRWAFKKQLEGHGFTNIHIRPFDWLHPATPPSLIPTVKAIGSILEALPLLREFSGSVLIQGQKAAQ